MNERQMPFYLVWSPKGGAPTVRHDTETQARKEAERLAMNNHGQTFVVLMSIGEVAVRRPVDWVSHEVPF